MELCKRCVYAHEHCSPEAMMMMEKDGVCCDFRPHRVNCSRCGEEVVHGARRTLICLDCLVELLDEEGAIFLMYKDRVRRKVK